MKKYTTYFSRAIQLSVFLLGLAASVLASQPSASAAGPSGCDSSRPYNCAMSRRKFDQQVNSWCGLANPDKQSECKLKFYSFVYRTAADIKSQAGFSIPTYCGTDGEKNNANYLDSCYVLTNRGTKYYAATKQLVTDCGLEPNQDVSCASDVKQQFLHDYNSSWASEPGSAASPNKSTGVDTSTKASETPFIRRVNIYLKWITAGIGILAVFGLVVAGIQYTAAGDNPQAVSDAKKRIANIVIGLLLYMFMFAALQWLVPGGIF